MLKPISATGLAAVALFLAMLVGLPTEATSQNKNRNKNRNRNMRSRMDAKALKVGQEAPNFKLKSLDGESETELSSFQGKKPVVLIFGSYS